MAIWQQHPEWEKYPHLFSVHDSMRKAASDYVVSVYSDPDKMAFVVRGHFAELQDEWAQLFFREYDDEANYTKVSGIFPPDEWLDQIGAFGEAVALYRDDYDKGICAGGRYRAAVAIHYFADYVSKALDNFGVEWQRGPRDNQPGEDKALALEADNKQPQQEKQLLPDSLNTEKARKIFGRAIAKGWIIKSGKGYKWLGIDGKDNRGSKGQLAYLCGKVYGYHRVVNNGVYSNGGDRVPYEALQALFNATRLDRALVQVYEAKKPQQWRSKIDTLFVD